MAFALKILWATKSGTDFTSGYICMWSKNKWCAVALAIQADETFIKCREWLHMWSSGSRKLLDRGNYNTDLRVRNLKNFLTSTGKICMLWFMLIQKFQVPEKPKTNVVLGLVC